MKKINILLIICIVITVANAAAIIYTHYFHPATSQSNGGIALPVDAPINSDIFMPATIDLAGETVPVHRRDIEEALKKELIVNTYLHSHTTQILKNAPRVFAIIEPILKANNIPDDFKYLAVIESRLDPLIVSPAGAASTWQIMKATGKELGLEISNDIDERYHLEKSTQAAAQYLKRAYNKFGSWTLAAASYNAGTGFLLKQMKIQKEQNYYNLLLGEETERYIYRILALKQIMTHPEKYNFQVNITYPAEPVETVAVDTTVKSWADFAHQQGITYKTLKRFNPWLRKPDLHNSKHKTYHIAIPKNKELYK